jgi:hypothetical protein
MEIQCSALVKTKGGILRQCQNRMEAGNETLVQIGGEELAFCHRHTKGVKLGYINNEDQIIEGEFRFPSRQSMTSESEVSIVGPSTPVEARVPSVPFSPQDPSKRTPRAGRRMKTEEVPIEEQLANQEEIDNIVIKEEGKDITLDNYLFGASDYDWYQADSLQTQKRIEQYLNRYEKIDVNQAILDYMQSSSLIPLTPEITPEIPARLPYSMSQKPIETDEQLLKKQLYEMQSMRIKLQRQITIKEQNGQDTTREKEELIRINEYIYNVTNALRGLPPLVQIPQPETTFQGVLPEPQNLAIETAIQNKLSLQSLPFQKQYAKTFFDLNQFIADSVRNKVFIDTNYIFGQIKANTGSFFDYNLTNEYLMPIFKKIQFYNEGRMLGFNPQDIQFATIVPNKPTMLYNAPPPNALPGTNNEIIFENIPDGGVYSQFMGKYGNIKHPEFPLVELKCNKNVISGKFVCTQKVDGKEKSRKFDDVYQAKGWAIRGGFYADKLSAMKQSSIQGRYERKLRVIPTIVR